ncbi:MAG: zinc-ribbon domain-containing protein [Anaerolineae bacterium]|nr:zinc-ribbon domain-containing protein [Anaerolineae bacterium]MDH7473032.1 zinc-ribbon domain-containing protein [Anaerolineae bacterium]
MKCPYCGAEVPEGDLYCGECGRKIEAAPPATAPAKKGIPAIPVAIGVGVVLCVCVAIVGVIAIPNLIPKTTATAVVVLPTSTPTRGVPTATPTKAATKTPKPTPSPTKPLPPTATPTSTPLPGPLLYEEDFGDPSSGWWTSSEADYEVAYQNGEYVFNIATEDYSVWTWGGKFFTDFVLEVEAGQVSGPDLNSYGVTFRFQDSDNFYRFSISGDGQYAIHRVLDGEWEELVPWTDSPAINAGAQWNLLRVACQGSYMNFYVNNVHLADVTDTTFTGGDVGFYVSTSKGAPNLQVAFDNLQVWRNDAPSVTKFTFEDDFSKELGGWETDLGEGRQAAYVDKQFEISILDPNIIGWSRV